MIPYNLISDRKKIMNIPNSLKTVLILATVLSFSFKIAIIT